MQSASAAATLSSWQPEFVAVVNPTLGTLSIIALPVSVVVCDYEAQLNQRPIC